MKNDDRCLAVDRSSGRTTTRNIDQQRHSNDSTGWWPLGFGVPISALGVLGMVNLVRTQQGRPLLGGSPESAPDP